MPCFHPIEAHCHLFFLTWQWVFVCFVGLIIQFITPTTSPHSSRKPAWTALIHIMSIKERKIASAQIILPPADNAQKNASEAPVPEEILSKNMTFFLCWTHSSTTGAAAFASDTHTHTQKKRLLGKFSPALWPQTVPAAGSAPLSWTRRGSASRRRAARARWAAPRWSLCDFAAASVCPVRPRPLISRPPFSPCTRISLLNGPGMERKGRRNI